MKQKKSITYIIIVGQLMINVPVTIIMIGFPAFVGLVILQENSALMALLAFVTGFILAWSWWSFTIVRWRIWAFENTAKKDWGDLKWRAIEGYLIWEDGNWYEKTEFRTKTQQEKIIRIDKEIERRTQITVKKQSRLNMGLFGRNKKEVIKKEEPVQDDDLITPEKQTELRQLGKVNVMMDETLFWQIIEKSRDFLYDQIKQEEYLSLYLDRFTLKEIIGFRLTTQKLIFETYNAQSWCAGTILNEGFYEAGEFESFLCLVISRGKEVYDAFRQNPDSLMSDLSKDMEFYNFDDFHSAPEMAFYGHVYIDMDGFVDLEGFTYSSNNYPELMVPWGENFYDIDDPKKMLKANCPQLFDKYWNKD